MNSAEWIAALRQHGVADDGNEHLDRAALFAETIAQYAEDDGTVKSASWHEWRRRTGDQIGWRGARWAMKNLRRHGWLERIGKGEYGCTNRLTIPSRVASGE